MLSRNEMRMHLYRILPAYVFPTTSADRPRIIKVQNKVSNVKEQIEFCMIDYCREGPMRKLYAPRRKSDALSSPSESCRCRYFAKRNKELIQPNSFNSHYQTYVIRMLFYISSNGVTKRASCTTIGLVTESSSSTRVP